MVCLDSGCGDYDRLWLTTSLRGIAAGTLTVRVLTEGVHSGDASGIVPSSFRLTRALLSRLEDEATGAIKLQDLYVQIPPQRIEQAKQAAEVLGDSVYTKFPFAGTTRPMAEERADMVLNRTWRPQLAVVGMDGYPTPQDAGNVLLPFSTTKLSLRLPPTLDAKAAVEAVKQALEADPPYGAMVEFDGKDGQSGWNAPALAPWLESGGRAGLAGGVRQARRLHGRRRLDPLHGDAGREISGCAVRDHRRAGSALERARTQRVPAYPDRQAGDRRGGPADRGASRAAALTLQAFRVVAKWASTEARSARAKAIWCWRTVSSFSSRGLLR